MYFYRVKIELHQEFNINYHTLIEVAQVLSYEKNTETLASEVGIRYILQHTVSKIYMAGCPMVNNNNNNNNNNNSNTRSDH